MDIAVIDSGMNPWHSHVGEVAGGVSLREDPVAGVVEEEDFSDEIGHGTAIAGLIREKVPRARLHAIKIFQKELRASTEVLLAALERAIRMRFKIIHLSLGTERREDRSELDRLCRDACRKRIVIVASARSPDDEVYPAALGTVIGVYWNPECHESSLVYHPGKPVEFGAHGRPRPLPGMPQDRNFCGSSFAAARVTAWAAQYLEQNPRAGSRWVKERLRGQAEGG
jgi:Subtilase family